LKITNVVIFKNGSVVARFVIVDKSFVARQSKAMAASTVYRAVVDSCLEPDRQERAAKEHDQEARASAEVSRSLFSRYLSATYQFFFKDTIRR
jgi:hypothetical protein